MKERTQASQCALDIQTDELLREGVFAILGSDHVVMFSDMSMLLDARKDEVTVTEVMSRHGYARYAFASAGAEKTFQNLRRTLSSELFVRENGKSYHVVAFTGWESDGGSLNLMHRPYARFLEVEDVTAVVQAANEAEEISNDDLEAASAFLGRRS